VNKGRAFVKLQVTNHQDKAVACALKISSPDGLSVEAPSAPVNIPAGETVSHTYTVDVPAASEAGAS